MHKILSILCLFVFKIVIIAQAPITLNNVNMPGANDTLRYTNAQITSIGNYTQTGANFNWNFFNLVDINQGVRTFKSSFQTPYSFYFLALNEYGEKIADTLGAGPITITNYWNYYKKQTSPVNAFIADGSGMTFSSIPVPSYFSDKDELYIFPMSYPKYDSTTFKFSTITSSLIPITYSKKGYRVTLVDGWGKIITPYDTANCIRLITTQYSKDTIKTNFGGFSFPFGFNNFQRSYQWFTINSKIPFLEITGNLVGNNFTVTQVRYRGYKKLSAPPPPPPPIDTSLEDMANSNYLSIYPNPVKDKLWISDFVLNKFLIEIYDFTGQLIKKQSIESSDLNRFIDVSEFNIGLYQLKISQNQKVNWFNFIKTN